MATNFLARVASFSPTVCGLAVERLAIAERRATMLRRASVLLRVLADSSPLAGATNPAGGSQLVSFVVALK